MTVFQIIELIIAVIGVLFTLLVNVGAIAFFWGKIVTKLSALEKVVESYKTALKEDIGRLEKKQDKHNGLYEKVTRAEESAKSAHHRLDTLEMRQRY